MTDNTKNQAAKAQENHEYSASEANKSNQRENAKVTGKKAHEGRDPMEGDDQGSAKPNNGGVKDTPI